MCENCPTNVRVGHLHIDLTIPSLQDPRLEIGIKYGSLIPGFEMPDLIATAVSAAADDRIQSGDTRPLPNVINSVLDDIRAATLRDSENSEIVKLPTDTEINALLTEGQQ